MLQLNNIAFLALKKTLKILQHTLAVNVSNKE